MSMDLHYTSATEIASSIASKQISPVEVVDQALARINQVNPAVNCFCFVYEEEARIHARRAEDLVMRGETLGPLHGVPVAFKDMTPTRGKRTTLGSRIFENWIPDHDAAIVERFAAAGAIMVGKTTTSELAATGFCETDLWGITRNPWNLDCAPGGSSGGSAVAVAAGCVPLAEGCDMGGSIRIPAAFCGIVGLKPSFGRIPFDILPSQFDTYGHFGPLARTVDDAALFLSVAQGQDDRDILSIRDRLDLPNVVPTDVRGMKLALSADLGHIAVDEEVERNFRAIASQLKALGAQVEEVKIDWDHESRKPGLLHWNVYMAAIAAQYLDEWRAVMDPVLIKAIEEGLKMDAVSFKQLEFKRSEQWSKIRPIFSQYDALLCPTAAITAPPVGTTDHDFGHQDESGRYVFYAMTFPFNLISPCPAMSVPSGFSASGLPTSIQIVGRPYDDLTVLNVGAAIEAIHPWAHRRPAL